MSKFILFIAALSLSACASRQKPMPVAPSLTGDIQIIERVPFFKQAAGHCGPATLTMVMHWAGKMVPLDQVVPTVYTEGMKGSLQMDMVTAARRQGLMALTVRGGESLVREIHAGHPVIVFQNLGPRWLPLWHYAVALGYDYSAREMIVHSGPRAFERVAWSEFDRAWQLGDYWGLVVLEPGHLSASAGELEHVTAAAALEQIQMFDEAAKAYSAILSRWPLSFGALMGAANSAHAHGKYLAAVDYLDRARRLRPASPMVWHNQAIAMAAAGRLVEARRSAREAVRLAPETGREQYRANLRAWLN